MNRKPIFDAVRQMLGRSFAQDEVDRLDRAIDAAEGSLPATSTPQRRPSAPTGGRVMAGLTRRRAAETALYRKP